MDYYTNDRPQRDLES
ncbi:MAG: hypothetical protein ACLTEE_03015 [Anaerobutyricum hallii]